MPDTLRIGHCADIHLDGSLFGEPTRGGRQPFVAALAAMRAHDPDLMLLAGDPSDCESARIRDSTPD